MDYQQLIERLCFELGESPAFWRHLTVCEDCHWNNPEASFVYCGKYMLAAS